MTINRKELFKTANYLVGQGMSRSEAMKEAWRLAKATVVEKVAGVTHGKRQVALEHLTRYQPEQISVALQHETTNTVDANAVAVIVTVVGRGAYQVGYLPAGTAAVLAPLLVRGVPVKAKFERIVGGYLGKSYGMRLRLAV